MQCTYFPDLHKALPSPATIITILATVHCPPQAHLWDDYIDLQLFRIVRHVSVLYKLYHQSDQHMLTLSKVRECLHDRGWRGRGGCTVWRRVLQLTQDTGTHKHSRLASRHCCRRTVWKVLARESTNTEGPSESHSHRAALHDLPLNLHGAREVITIQNTWKQG